MFKEEQLLLEILDRLLVAALPGYVPRDGYELTYYNKEGKLCRIGLTPPEDHDSQGHILDC